MHKKTEPSSEVRRISAAATQSTHARVEPLRWELLHAKAAQAKANPRLREIHVLHTGDEDTLQRMLNALQPGTYIRPHRHATPPKAEAVVVLQGRVAFVPFTEAGEPDEANWALMDPRGDTFGVDYRAGLWHTFIALAPDSVMFEVKPGPYAATSDKDFAPWAPPEDTPEARHYLTWLEERFRSAWAL